MPLHRLTAPARVFLTGLLAVLLTGCGAGWRNIPMSNQGSLTPNQETQVWVHNVGMFRLKQLHWTPDSVFGRPYLSALDGGTATVGIPRARVDSIRTGNPTKGFLNSVGLGLLITIVLLTVLCAGGACGTST